MIAGTDRLQRLDFSMRPEDDVDVDAAAAAVAAEQAARQKRQQLHKLSKHAHESQQVGQEVGGVASRALACQLHQPRPCSICDACCLFNEMSGGCTCCVAFA